MIFPKAKKIAKELDWHKTNESVFGLYKGYFFNVSDSSLFSNPQFKFVSATLDTLSDNQIMELKAALDKNKKVLKFSNYELSGNQILFLFAETLTYTKIKTVYALFDFLVGLFKDLAVPVQNKCHNCGATQRIENYNLNENGIILCNSCYDATVNSFTEIENERLASEKNYFIGFLGSLLFSIPGIIAWVLIAVYLERLASGMALVIAFFGLKGYEYFKGKQGKLTKVFIVITNIISILAANYITVIVLMLKAGFTLTEAITEFETNQVAKDIFNENTIISFILSFLVWMWLLFIMKDKKLSIQLAERFE